MKSKVTTIKLILSTLAVLVTLLPMLAFAQTPPPATATAPVDTSVKKGGTPADVAPAADAAAATTGGTGIQKSGTPDELFYQFKYTNSTTTTSDGSNIGAVNAIASSQSWQSVLAMIIKNLLNISGGLALICFTIAGVLMVTSRGKPDMFEKGKKLLTAAIAGLIIISISYALVLGVSNLQFFTAGAGGGAPVTTAPKK